MQNLHEDAPHNNGEPPTQSGCVDKIIQLLGKDVILIPVRPRTKKALVKWKTITIDIMSDPIHLRLLAGNNIAAILGHRSGGLCSIDVDDDALLEPFLAQNPHLSTTLRSKGGRGCNFWIRMDGTYPRLKELAFPDKRKFGEWRSDGAYTMIVGEHPSGVRYQLLVDQSPAIMRFEDIVWPADLGRIRWQFEPEPEPELLHSNTVTEPHSSRATQQPSCPAAEQPSSRATHAVVEEGKEGILTAAALAYLPTAPEQNDGLLFRLSRHLLDTEKQLGRTLSEAEERFVFAVWYFGNQHLKPDETEEDYWIKFMHARSNAAFGLKDMPLELAWAAANEQPFPAGAEKIEDHKGKLLLALCYHLQRLRRDGKFFLSSHAAAKLFDVDPMWVWRRLVHYSRLKILEPLQKGSHAEKKASWFRYVEGTAH